MEKEQIENNIVANAEYKVIAKTDDKSASKIAQEWVENNYKEPARTEIGNVAITKRSIKDSLSHGYSQDKLDSISTIKIKDDAIHKGGINIFGKNFGDFDQSIVLTVNTK